MRNHSAYLPFGNGPRSCLGTRFALVQVRAALFHLAQHFRTSVSPNHKPIRFGSAGLLQVIDGLLINVECREWEWCTQFWWNLVITFEPNKKQPMRWRCEVKTYFSLISSESLVSNWKQPLTGVSRNSDSPGKYSDVSLPIEHFLDCYTFANNIKSHDYFNPRLLSWGTAVPPRHPAAPTTHGGTIEPNWCAKYLANRQRFFIIIFNFQFEPTSLSIFMLVSHQHSHSLWSYCRCSLASAFHLLNTYSNSLF